MRPVEIYFNAGHRAAASTSANAYYEASGLDDLIAHLEKIGIAADVAESWKTKMEFALKNVLQRWLEKGNEHSFGTIFWDLIGAGQNFTEVVIGINAYAGDVEKAKQDLIKLFEKYSSAQLAKTSIDWEE